MAHIRCSVQGWPSPLGPYLGTLPSPEMSFSLSGLPSFVELTALPGTRLVKVQHVISSSYDPH